MYNYMYMFVKICVTCTHQIVECRPLEEYVHCRTVGVEMYIHVLYINRKWYRTCTSLRYCVCCDMVCITGQHFTSYLVQLVVYFVEDQGLVVVCGETLHNLMDYSKKESKL